MTRYTTSRACIGTSSERTNRASDGSVWAARDDAATGIVRAIGIAVICIAGGCALWWFAFAAGGM